jgi:SOS-response transcriptional repressor LexA
MKQAWVAREAGITPASLSNILTGRTADPSFSAVAAIARAIGTPLAALFGERPEPLLETEREALRRAVEILENRLLASGPVLRGGSDGAARLAPEAEALPRYDVPSAIARRGARLVFRAVGDSMAEEGIRDGDVLYVKPVHDFHAANGRMIVCRLDAALLVRKLVITGRSTRLQSGGGGSNYINVTDDRAFELIGVVVAHLAEM